jgi:hypothetical protein
MGESISALMKELGPQGIAGLIGGVSKGVGGMVKAFAGDDSKNQHMLTNELTPAQSGVAGQLANSFGLSQGGQPLQGQPGLGGNLQQRAQMLLGGIQKPNTNRFGLGG